jgi:hypothetical protein
MKRKPKLRITSHTVGEKVDSNSAFVDEDNRRRSELDAAMERERRGAPLFKRVCPCGAEFTTRVATKTACAACTAKAQQEQREEHRRLKAARQLAKSGITLDPDWEEST